jgi:chromate transporter
MAPSVAMVIGLSWFYFTFHAMPALYSAMRGLGPVVIALILAAAWSMGRKALRSWPAALLAVAAVALSLFKVNSLVALSLRVAVGLAAGKPFLSGKAPGAERPRPAPALLALGVAPAMGAPVAASLPGVAWAFLKVGCIFFGGGFVLVPVLHQKMVVASGWLSPREFIDGVAISNLTPGPIAVLATFAGYRVQGVAGALVATLALFAPALALMSLLSHFYSRLKDLHHAQNLLAGLTPAMVGLILGAALLLAPGAIHGLMGLLLFGGALLLLLGLRWHPAFVLALGALAGVAGWIR